MYVGPLGIEVEVDTRDLEDLLKTKQHLHNVVSILPTGEARTILNFIIGAMDANISRAERDSKDDKP